MRAADDTATAADILLQRAIRIRIVSTAHSALNEIEIFYRRRGGRGQANSIEERNETFLPLQPSLFEMRKKLQIGERKLSAILMQR